MMPKSKSHGRRRRQELALQKLMIEAQEYEDRTGHSIFESFSSRHHRIADEIGNLRRELGITSIEADRES